MNASANGVLPASSSEAAHVSSDPQTKASPLRPQRHVAVEGTLLTARATRRTPDEVSRYCQDALGELVGQAILWPTTAPAGETWTGTFRFLAVQFDVPDGSCYGQIWSEPSTPVLLEVGPGERTDPARVAAEMLALVSEVLGYDGTTDLQYRFCQSSHLRADRVVQRVSPAFLQRVLAEWDIRAAVPPNVADALEASAHGFDVRFYFFDQCGDHPGEFEEVHAMCIVRMDESRAREIVTRVNTTRFAFRAWPISADASRQAGVCFTLPLTLAGGVTLRALQLRLDDWFGCLRSLCAR